jgi:hypothetical protein
MKDFWGKVHTLRWDDHRYYHQCRINQTLHWISAISFLIAYGMLWTDPASAGLIGWLVGMVTRQSGHIFFEPRGYDHANQATYEFKATQRDPDRSLAITASPFVRQSQPIRMDSTKHKCPRILSRCGLDLAVPGHRSHCI